MDIHSIYSNQGDTEVYYVVETDTSESGVGGWTTIGEPGYGKLADAQKVLKDAATKTYNRVRILMKIGIVFEVVNE